MHAQTRSDVAIAIRVPEAPRWMLHSKKERERFKPIGYRDACIAACSSVRGAIVFGIKLRTYVRRKVIRGFAISDRSCVWPVPLLGVVPEIGL